VLKAALVFVKNNEWGNVMTYFLWAFTGTYHLLALFMLALALRQHEALHVITVYEATSIAVGAVSGNMVLQEYVVRALIASPPLLRGQALPTPYPLPCVRSTLSATECRRGKRRWRSASISLAFASSCAASR
jgi:hypothetical protein